MPDPDITIYTADWKQHRDSLQKIRRQVFIDEQHVPEVLEWDEYDAVSDHFLVTIDSSVIATARLKPDGQIGRMAVQSEYRNQGIGSRLLKYILHHAEDAGHRQLYLHAQATAISFYEKQGFSAHGKIFYEADIPHRLMTLELTQNS